MLYSTASDECVMMHYSVRGHVGLSDGRVFSGKCVQQHSCVVPLAMLKFKPAYLIVCRTLTGPTPSPFLFFFDPTSFWNGLHFLPPPPPSSSSTLMTFRRVFPVLLDWSTVPLACLCHSVSSSSPLPSRFAAFSFEEVASVVRGLDYSWDIFRINLCSSRASPPIPFVFSDFGVCVCVFNSRESPLISYSFWAFEDTSVSLAGCVSAEAQWMWVFAVI